MLFSVHEKSHYIIKMKNMVLKMGCVSSINEKYTVMAKKNRG